MNFIAGVQQKQMKPIGNGLMSDKHHPEKSQGAWLSAVSDQKINIITQQVKLTKQISNY